MYRLKSMAAKLGTFLSTCPVIYGEENALVSIDLSKYENLDSTFLETFDVIENKVISGLRYFRATDSNRWPIVGTEYGQFFRDYYFRIHVAPLLIELQTVASSQTREVTVWNSYPYTFAQLNEILLSNSSGIEVNGALTPYAMAPLEELTYDVTVTTAGPPNINVEIQFDFSNVFNPPAILVTGSRAVKFDVVPEIPVVEVWQWLTDNIVAVDGTEQRIAVRGEVPRFEQTIKVIFETAQQQRKFYSDLLASLGRLWIPEFQYAVRTTTASAALSFQLNYDNAKTDLRPGEYALIQTVTNSALVEIESLNASGALVAAPLAFAIPTGSLLMPGAPALINDGTRLSRYAVNEVGETTVTAKMIKQRSQLERIGSEIELPTFLGDALILKRPLAESLVDDGFSTGQQSIENQTGLPDLITRWDYTRIVGERQFKVNRIHRPEEMDYWKAVLAHARGAARKFWVPTFRPDLQISARPAVAASSLTVQGVEYAEKVFSVVSHRYIEIETLAGIHRTTITGATVFDVNTVLAINPSMPSGETWRDIIRISYLLPVRLADDKVTWKHYGLESLLELSIITAEP
ncbi:hypothetical protein [Pseudomonas phage KP1]|uniref:Virion structural protein n=1 Tax=Pseudomonas phage KP1 TaxID=2562463 RepID=A0A6G5QAJ8_9CAUD|nr:tail assembly protein [Pseudomonas phage KP1]QBZ71731.1 hypothetical protein [Pseudomonas phage KP1]